MATYRKRGKAWRVEVNRNGIRRSGTFDTKTEAVNWGTKTEAEILAGSIAMAKDITYAAMLEKYSEDVSPKKGGMVWEQRRLAAFARTDLGKKKIADLTSEDFAKWRDDRLKVVKPGTVNRDWNLLSNVFSIAIKEWRWLASNPMSDVKRPPPTPGRERLPTDSEIAAILHVLGYRYDETPETIGARVGAAYLFAMQTGMRESEIARLEESDINHETRVAKVRKSKTPTGRREVPLSREAMRIIDQLPKSSPLFGLTPASIDVNFRKAKKDALVDGLTFHDSRAKAATMLSKKLDLLALARVLGIKKLSVLQVYYRKSAADMVADLD